MKRRTISGDLPLADAGQILVGIAGSHGIAIASAVIMEPSRVGYARRRLRRDDELGFEWDRFSDAVSGVQAELRQIISKIDAGRPEASILEAYLLMVGDEKLASDVKDNIHKRRRCADWAVDAATNTIADQLGNVDDPYIRERRHDIEFVGQRLLRALGGGSEPGVPPMTQPSIVVAHDLSPADTASMMSGPVVGLVTEVGSRTSHTSIMARALGIPAVVGVKDALQQIGTGDALVVDGLRGHVMVEPDEKQREEAQQRLGRYQIMSQERYEHKDDPCTTQDNVRVQLQANIELPSEAAILRDHGAEGIGLYRTEFLYVNRSEPPTEHEQFKIFEEVLSHMKGRTVTLRTFDIGGDKFVTAFRVPRELNPMLGLRAIRLALSEPEIFFAHLCAMIRATALGDVRIMVPMVATLNELELVRALFDDARQHVRAQGHAQAEQIPLGIMVEVPAAAIMAPVFAPVVDFMSIGTNDLVQYALAVDRTNHALAHLASPFDPAILFLIRRVIMAGKASNRPVSLCGEMASDVYGALLLVGLGMRELSMESAAILEVKEAISRIGLDELETLARDALALSTAREVEQLLATQLGDRLRDLVTGQPNSSRTHLRPASAP